MTALCFAATFKGVQMMINSWMIHNVKRRRAIGVNDRGDLVLGPEMTIKARVEYKQKMIRSTGGREIVATAVMATLTQPFNDDSYALPSVAGSPADVFASEWRSPVSIEGSVTKTGAAKLWLVYFA